MGEKNKASLYDGTSFQILCVTMHQNGFSKITEMNIHSNVVFANQSNTTSYEEHTFGCHVAKMITTETRGVGVNRNITLLYADSDICLFADDDVKYVDEVEELIVKEFKDHSDADIIVFNIVSSPRDVRVQKQYSKTRKHYKWERMPWGGVRIAFRLSSVRKANVWFTTLFGGGATFASGEDSMWLKEAKRKGLIIYVSKETIGEVSFHASTWYSGRDEKLFFARGAYIQATYRCCRSAWSLYYALRLSKGAQFGIGDRLKWIRRGRESYDRLISFEEAQENGWGV